MAIEITKPTVVPERTYDKVYMQRLQIDQKMTPDNRATPYYTLQIEYRTYAVDEGDKRHYDGKVHIITIEDYVSEAMEKAGKGEMDLIVAMQSIEKALALIIEDKTDLGNSTVI